MPACLLSRKRGGCSFESLRLLCLHTARGLLRPAIKPIHQEVLPLTASTVHGSLVLSSPLLCYITHSFYSVHIRPLLSIKTLSPTANNVHSSLVLSSLGRYITHAFYSVQHLPFQQAPFHRLAAFITLALSHNDHLLLRNKYTNK